TAEKAIELKINGWVRNLPDNSVEAVFEGEKSQVEALIDWCSNHQPYARVSNTEVHWEEPKGKYKRFQIRR
ncbi:MAG: acylphosphatase, partial [Thermoplasmata archaeon]